MNFAHKKKCKIQLYHLEICQIEINKKINKNNQIFRSKTILVHLVNILNKSRIKQAKINQEAGKKIHSQIIEILPHIKKILIKSFNYKKPPQEPITLTVNPKNLNSNKL